MQKERWDATIEYQPIAGLVPYWAIGSAGGGWDAGQVVMSGHQQHAAGQRWDEQEDFAEQWLRWAEWKVGMLSGRGGDNTIKVYRRTGCGCSNGMIEATDLGGELMWHTCPYCEGQGYKEVEIDRTPEPTTWEAAALSLVARPLPEWKEALIAFAVLAVIAALVLSYIGAI